MFKDEIKPLGLELIVQRWELCISKNCSGLGFLIIVLYLQSFNILCIGFYGYNHCRDQSLEIFLSRQLFCLLRQHVIRERKTKGTILFLVAFTLSHYYKNSLHINILIMPLAYLKNKYLKFKWRHIFKKATNILTESSSIRTHVYIHFVIRNKT